MNGGMYGDWNKAIRTMDGDRFLRDLAKHGAAANERSGLAFVALASKAIVQKKYAPNSEVTVALKGTSSPLIGGGSGSTLVASLTHDVPAGGLILWVGVNRNAKSADGTELAPIAKYLHDGFTVDLQKHPKVRIAVMCRLREAAKGKGRGAKQARDLIAAMRKNPGHKDIWVVPARPFIGDVVEGEAFGVIFLDNASEAVHAALEG